MPSQARAFVACYLLPLILWVWQLGSLPLCLCLLIVLEVHLYLARGYGSLRARVKKQNKIIRMPAAQNACIHPDTACLQQQNCVLTRTGGHDLVWQLAGTNTNMAYIVVVNSTYMCLSSDAMGISNNHGQQTLANHLRSLPKPHITCVNATL